MIQLNLELTIDAKQLDPDMREQLSQFHNNPTVMALFELGTLYEQRGYEDVAMMAYEKLYKEASHFTPAKVELADLYFKKGRFSEAKEMYYELIEENKTFEQDQMIHNLGIIAWKEGNTTEAIKLWKRVISEFPGFTVSYDALIAEAREKGDLQKV